MEVDLLIVHSVAEDTQGILKIPKTKIVAIDRDDNIQFLAKSFKKIS